MTVKGKLLGVMFLIVLGFIAMLVFGNKPQNVSFPSRDVPAEVQVDKEIEELNIILMDYQLDVYVTSAHSSTHDTSSAALRCLNNKGNIQAFSEFNTRRIHLLCWDNDTLYDIIINRINYWVERFKNPKSELVTAYSPENVQGVDQLSKAEAYIEHLKNTVGGKAVRLHFGPGEVMFIPK
jgi:hypothetical protein